MTSRVSGSMVIGPRGLSPESDAALAQAIGQPMVLIEADTGGEWKVGADAHEHSPPVTVVDVKVVLNDPAISDLKMPSVRDLVALLHTVTRVDGSCPRSRFVACPDNAW